MQHISFGGFVMFAVLAYLVLIALGMIVRGQRGMVVVHRSIFRSLRRIIMWSLDKVGDLFKFVARSL